MKQSPGYVEVLKEEYDLVCARDAALRRATQAEQRERIAADAYNGQQQSYRELETLYQASQERALRAEADATALQEAAERLYRWHAVSNSRDYGLHGPGCQICDVVRAVRKAGQT